jgi:hypothetical protein
MPNCQTLAWQSVAGNQTETPCISLPRQARVGANAKSHLVIWCSSLMHHVGITNTYYIGIVGDLEACELSGLGSGSSIDRGHARKISYRRRSLVHSFFAAASSFHLLCCKVECCHLTGGYGTFLGVAFRWNDTVIVSVSLSSLS